MGMFCPSHNKKITLTEAAATSNLTSDIWWVSEAVMGAHPAEKRCPKIRLFQRLVRIKSQVI